MVTVSDNECPEMECPERSRPAPPADGDAAPALPDFDAIALFPAPDMRTRILLVADDPALASRLGDYLEAAGFIVYPSDERGNAATLANSYRFDIIILDMPMLADGAGLLAELGEAHPDVPIIVLSADAALRDLVEVLASGADDLVAKPVHEAELLARIHAILRRQHSNSPKTVRIGALTVDFESRRAFVDGRDVRLTGKEYNCLELLATRQGMTITKEMFLHHLYSGRDEPEMKIIDVFVCKVRRKLRDAGADGIIETVWGRGYVIRARD